MGGRLAGRLGSKVDKTGTPLAPTTVSATAHAARTMRVTSGTSLALCGLLLLLLTPCALGLVPQSRGEGAYVRWGTRDVWPLTPSLGDWAVRRTEVKWDMG